MQNFNLINVLYFIFSSKNNFNAVIKKIFIKLFDIKTFLYKNKNLDLLKKNSIQMNSFLENINSELNKESVNISKFIKKESLKKIKKIKYNLGGSANLVLLYFITRFFKPKFILETGVAAGFSSYAFLKAIKKNKKGVLYSSDLPYFRIKNPSKYIGIIVPQGLKSNYWHLYTEGDSVNIFNIRKKVKTFDLIHYDSDKSYLGRYFFFKNIESMIKQNTIIIMDDLHNNIFFFDYIRENKITNYKIIENNNHFVGLIFPKSKKMNFFSNFI
jgi:predicted O-methyltransferase YrrM